MLKKISASGFEYRQQCITFRTQQNTFLSQHRAKCTQRHLCVCVCVCVQLSTEPCVRIIQPFLYGSLSTELLTSTHSPHESEQESNQCNLMCRGTPITATPSMILIWTRHTINGSDQHVQLPGKPPHGKHQQTNRLLLGLSVYYNQLTCESHLCFKVKLALI